MPCTVKKTFEAARKAKCHLLVHAKENQPGLARKIKEAAEMNAPLARHETIDRNKRMRAETRIVELLDAAPALERTAWNGLIARIIRVRRITLKRRAKDGMWDRREETSLYVCSAPISVKMAADASRIRTNPGIFARARSFALNILRANGEQNIANALWYNALDLNRPLAYRFK